MNTPSDNPYFQVGLDVADRPCLVIGGGPEAEDKSARLLEAGARLVVVAAEATARLQSWAREERLGWHRRPLRMEDLDGVDVVVNTVSGDPSMTRQVYERACRNHALINSYDDPRYSNFGMAALVHPGSLRISISTSNASPALARRVRQDLERLFDDEFVDYMDQLKRVREKLRQKMDDGSARRELLRSLVAGFRLEGSLVYPEGWRQQLEDLLADLPEDPLADQL